MRLRLRVAAPRVERVVDEHPPLQHRVVVGEHRRQPERGREEARRLRASDRASTVSAARTIVASVVERRVRELVPADERIEAALGPDVRVVDVRDVVRAWRRSRRRTRAPRRSARRRTPPTGSMKRRMSHGHAMRSIFGRSRVTQRVGAANGSRRDGPRRASARGRPRGSARRGRARAAPPRRPGSPRGRARSRRRPGATARASPAQASTASGRRRIAPGMTLGICVERRLPAHVDERRRRKCREPMLRVQGE